MDLNLSTNSSVHAGVQEPSFPPKPKLRRYLFLFIFLGLSLYLILPQFGAVERALLVIRHLRPFFLGLSVATQVLSYLGSGYLLKKTIGRTNGPVSVQDGTLITIAANSIGTLGWRCPWNHRNGLFMAAAPGV